MTGQERHSIEIDTSRPHPARMYDWFLGGKDNYPVDEQMARQLLTLDARGRDMARVNRAFMHRATRWLTEQGVRQFLDIGTGIPTEPNLHQIAQQAAPDARVVYCDNDPIVLAHAAALLRSTPEGATEYIQADARRPETILAEAGKVLDFEQPVALSLLALLHFIDDEDGAAALVGKLVEQLPSGSYLVLSHTTGDFDPAMRWVGLEILDTTEGSVFHSTGTVTFRAHYTDDGRPDSLHEKSRFVRHEGAWVYTTAVFVD